MFSIEIYEKPVTEERIRISWKHMRYASRELSRVLLSKIEYKIGYRRIGIYRLSRGALE